MLLLIQLIYCNLILVIVCDTILSAIIVDILICYRLVMGWLRFHEAERKFDCINSPNTVRTIVFLV